MIIEKYSWSYFGKSVTCFHCFFLNIFVNILMKPNGWWPFEYLTVSIFLRGFVTYYLIFSHWNGQSWQDAETKSHQQANV